MHDRSAQTLHHRCEVHMHIARLPSRSIAASHVLLLRRHKTSPLCSVISVLLMDVYGRRRTWIFQSTMSLPTCSRRDGSQTPHIRDMREVRAIQASKYKHTHIQTHMYIIYIHIYIAYTNIYIYTHTHTHTHTHLPSLSIFKNSISIK